MDLVLFCINKRLCPYAGEDRMIVMDLEMMRVIDGKPLTPPGTRVFETINSLHRPPYLQAATAHFN